ncbi:hypothetical protein BH11MYX4_BH11MYX4_06380 [soil metagenome]
MVAAFQGCVPADTRPVPGSLTVTVSPSPGVLGGVVTADGWSVSFERVLVAIGGVRLGDSCLTYTEPDYDRVLDVTTKAQQKLSITYAVGTRSFGFRVMPPSTDALLGDGVTEDDKTLLRTPGADAYVERGGIAYSIAGHATRGAVTKRFQLLFRPRVRYQNCVLVPDGGDPVDLPSASSLVYDIRIEAEAVLREDLDAAAALRFEPFANADTNGDGQITLDELRAVPIATVRDGGAFEAGTYDVDDAGVLRQGRPIVIETFGDYVYEVLIPSIPRFKESGTCRPAVRGTIADGGSGGRPTGG